MPFYAYKAIDKRGSASEGEFEVPDPKDVDQYFLQRDLTPVRIERKDAKPGSAEAGQNEKPLFNFMAKKKLYQTELIAFTRQFAAAYGAGLAVADILDLLAKQTKHAAFKECLLAISLLIRSGKGMTESFMKFPRFFDSTYLAILNSGEISGNLDTTLNYSASLMEKKLMHRERLDSTLLYPKLVLGMIGITGTVVVIFVIPQFAKLYDKFEAELPLPTLILVGVAQVVKVYWWAVLAALPLIFIGIQYLKRNVRFMLWWDEKMLNMPILGETFLKMELTHFCTTFALLLRSGVKITNATQVAIDGMRNSFLRSEMGIIIPTLEEGGSLASALERVGVVPPLMASMIAIGEQSGTLETLLDRVSALYDNETEMMLKKLPTLLEPVILGGLFVLVLLLALAVYLPMWRMAQLIKR